MIKLVNISHSFAQQPILNHFHLQVKEGEFVVIMGDNGAGKSTVCNLISGKLLPNSGQVFLAGQDVTALNEHKRASVIAHVFQDPKAGTNGAMSEMTFITPPTLSA